MESPAGDAILFKTVRIEIDNHPEKDALIQNSKLRTAFFSLSK
jgi:hypothetical protein